MDKEYLIQYRRLLQLRDKIDHYELKTIQETVDVYDKAVKGIKENLKKTRSLETQAQLKKTLTTLKKAHKAFALLVKDSIKEGVSKVGVETFKGMAKILSWDGKDKDFNAHLDRADIMANAIENVPVGGKPLAEWVNKIFEETGDLQKTILAQNLAGGSYRKMYNDLVKLYPDFLRSELISLARTYNQSVVTSSQEKLFKENKDIVKKMRWTAAMEMGYSKSGKGTCPSCAALDGNDYDMDAYHPNCPLHVRCRCMWAPITVSWDELFEKHNIVDKDDKPLTIDEMEEEYKPFLTRKPINIDLGRGKGNILNQEWTDKPYGEFITSKGKEALINVVGPNRAQLIMDGKIKFGDIVDRQTGRLKTLKELGFPLQTKIPKIKKGGGSAPPTTTLSLEGTNFLRSASTKKDKYEAILKDLPEDMKEIIRKYPKPNTIEIGDGVYWSQTNRLSARPDEGNGRVFVHEYGHHIDSMIGDKVISTGVDFQISSKFEPFKDAFDKDGKRLKILPSDELKALPNVTPEERTKKMTEYQKFYNERGDILRKMKEDLYIPLSETLSDGRKLMSNVLVNEEMSAYSDIIDAMAGGDFWEDYGGHGHGRDYYSTIRRRYSETFAQLFSGRGRDTETWNKMKTDFSSLVETFEQILKDAIKLVE